MNQWQPREYDPNLHSRRTQQPPYGQPQYPPQQPPYGYQQPQSNAFPQQPEFRPPPQPSQPPRKSRKGLAFFGCGGLGALVVLIAILAAPSSPSSSSPPAVTQTVQAAAPPAQSSAPAAAAQTVTYVVTGSAADVTYGPTGTSISGAVPMHVSKPLGTPQYYSVSAQLQGGGAVSCKIEVDGKVISQSTASGSYNIASCEISQDPFSGAWTDTNG